MIPIRKNITSPASAAERAAIKPRFSELPTPAERVEKLDEAATTTNELPRTSRKPLNMDAEVFDHIVDAVCVRLEPVFAAMLRKLIEQRDQIIEVGMRLEKKPRKKPPAEQGWVQLKEAAHQVGYSVESLRRYGDAGKFVMRLYKGKYFVRLPDVMEFFIEQLNS
jgi:hypothetical protein